jgi:two-component system, cell cycle response regulator
MESDKLTVLFADDEAINRSVVNHVLTRAGYNVVTANNGAEALQEAIKIIPDLIILDIMMPMMDGMQACRLIKSNPKTKDIPILFFSAITDTEQKVNGLMLGANDYINKPVKNEELVARVNIALRLKQERDQLLAKAEEANRMAVEAQEKSMIDGLTGVLNRSGLQRALASEYCKVQRYNRPLACLMIDLDHFKKINDTYGHLVGDTVIKEVANYLTKICRGSDVVCRYGGEEFIIILPETDLTGAVTLGQRIRTSVAEHQFRSGDTFFPVTLSVGVAELVGEETVEDMIGRADAALYRAKNEGRNRVIKAA